MNRMMAIVEREMRKFFRSPTLMLASMIFPLVQLIVLGNAFGGKIKDARVGVVDQDGGTQAVKIREAFDSVRANMRTFEPVYYDDEKTAREDVRNGKIQGAVIIPPQYSRRVYEQDRPQIALVVDNSDNFMSSTLEGELSDLTNALNQPTIEPRFSTSPTWDASTTIPGQAGAMTWSIPIISSSTWIPLKARSTAR